MIDISMEMEQHDCPFIDTTLDHDVSFSAVQWEFDVSNHELETRMVVQGASRSALNNGMTALREHSNMYNYQLRKRWDDTAQIRTVIHETDAMDRIRSHDGFITGPFYIEDGSELWHVGFDSAGVADKALSELDHNNEFDVMSRDEHGGPLVQETVTNVNAGLELVDACRDLTEVEREALKAAVDQGYFESPRGTTLNELAEQFDISAPAFSKNLRRGQQKVTRHVVQTLESLSESDTDGLDDGPFGK
ncbi:helix-turn-helix domain-containing protein [Halovenus rubra]|uniref:Helix-turn-helix domain-containing protein n=2 Tax=Halovenus rubra TaxID=869890 RepID=A0ACC7E1S6_9EURY|nr:helix-turn-helix domain-containing protein [Halovenus rubra]